MLFLVFSHGNLVGFLYEDVNGHQCRIGEKACVHALVGIGAYYLFLYVVTVALNAKGLTRLVLERGGAHQFADAHVHVKQQIQFRNLRHVALDENGGFLGVEACGQIFRKYILHVCVELFGVRVRGQGVEVGHEKHVVVSGIVLHSHEVAQCAVIIA